MSVRSPSGASACVTVSGLFATGMLSPVSADSATSSVAAFSSRPSAGTTSPASIATMSPGTSCSAGTSTSSPPRRTFALMIIIFCRAATAAAAFPSWLRPRTALNSVRKSRTRPVPSSWRGQMLPIPATSRTTCIGSRYWRTNARQRGSVSAATKAFGPYFSSRVPTSAGESPACSSTPSSWATASPASANHCLSWDRAGGGAVVAIAVSKSSARHAGWASPGEDDVPPLLGHYVVVDDGDGPIRADSHLAEGRAPGSRRRRQDSQHRLRDDHRDGHGHGLRQGFPRQPVEGRRASRVDRRRPLDRPPLHACPLGEHLGGPPAERRPGLVARSAGAGD